ncbi:MAG: hypothetical protein HN961_03345 [Planctomycetes bacterium]|jgi:penicillin-binding protein 2|nr:hypothetical protein [Planctomycetota bacterium]MBT5101817.1 hypothetical protein [Planctomycetota bacterium]MBT7011929.1 hypothetical protein [Planctomycetota bacterium]
MRSSRHIRLILVCLAFLALLIGRLFQLQVVQHQDWAEEARRSRLSKRSLPFYRGRILDKTGIVLAEDRISYDFLFEYRSFRRGNPIAQLLEAWALLGYAPGGLDACANQGLSLAAGLFAKSPNDLESLDSGSKGDFVYYLRRLGGKPDWSDIQAWMAREGQPFQEAFPHAFASFESRFSQSLIDLRVLEVALGDEWKGALLPRIEKERLRLEFLIRRRAVLAAAGRPLDWSSFQVREQLLWRGEGEAPERWQIERTAFLKDVATRWQMPRDLEALAASMLADGELAFETLGALLRHAEKYQPADVRGLRRGLVRDIHSARQVRLKRNLPFEVVDRLARLPERHPGLFVQESPIRVYPDSVVPQLLGTVRAASEKDLREYQDLREEYLSLARLLHLEPHQEARYQDLRNRLWTQVLRPGDSRGRRGLESAFEDVLKGTRGYLQVLEVGDEDEGPLELAFAPPRHGEDIRLAIDASLQKAAEAAISSGYREVRRQLSQESKPQWAVIEGLKTPRAAIAIIDLQDGTTPVLATAPSYEAADFRADYSTLADDQEGAPLRHRALAGGFAGWQTPYPGSTFKLVASAEALAQDPEAWETVYLCEGSYQAPGATRALKCDSRWGHGEISMREAIQHSCNVYFYRLAEKLGYSALLNRAHSLGFGSATGIEVTQADPWLERGANSTTKASGVYGVISTMRFAIGQTHITASPLQMARFFGWLATGKLWAPRLVLEGRGATPAVQKSQPMPLAKTQLNRIREALQAVTNEPGGTAYSESFSLRDFRVAGKTGTAQVGGKGKHGRTHAWFTGYFPWDEPRYAVAVMCENAGLHGGQIATVVLHEFLSSAAAEPLVSVFADSADVPESRGDGGVR